ncbi:3-methyladenine DNA glycosylase [Rhodobacterales bacterium 52_120_T64]|nr:3-methyladenine DNA glycosylase [Rhodobacterales bacterium 52_120_T64]
MSERIIKTDADVAEGAAWLAAYDPRFANALELCGPLPLRRREDGFRELLSAITSQQLSVASANSIWVRMEAAGMCDPAPILAASEAEFRACGFSRQKIGYAQDLAAADLDYAAFRTLPSDEVMRQLIAIRGIGTWTAEIYVMFSLGRADVFAPGDLALQEAAKVLFNLDERPTEKELRKMSEKWTPWRSVAARLLWAYYRVEKEREGIR